MKKIIFLIVLALSVSGSLMSQDPEIEYNIIKPNASTTWFVGNTNPYKIQWDKKGDTCPQVRIRLFTSPGNVKTLHITDSTSNDGSFDCYLPADLNPGAYYVKVRSSDGKNWGFSTPFKIRKKYVAVPNTKEFESKKPTFKPPKGFGNPKITTVFNYFKGSLKPGQKVILEGKLFGKQKGNIYLKGAFPGGKLLLEQIVWESDTKVNGKVPMSSNGTKNHDVKVVLVTSLNLKSNEWSAKFEGREEKVLTSDAVGVQCGTDANWNTCNQFVKSDDGFGTYCDPNHAMCGYHSNAFATIGDDTGTDFYSINLKNGWVLKSIEKVVWTKSSDDELLEGPSPAFPAGQSVWNAAIRWVASPNDNVRYRIKIMVEGPIGTNYK